MSIEAVAITYTEQKRDYSNLTLTKWTIDPSKLQPNQVIVKTLGSPINPADLGRVRGGYVNAPYKHDLGETKGVYVGGNEGALEVIHAGSGVTEYAVGDVVVPVLTGFGTWRTHAVVDVDDPHKTADGKVPVFVKVPRSIPVLAAATLDINPPTAYQIYHDYVKLQKGDWIIQNAGTSQVSQYITQLAKRDGVQTISVVRDGKSKEQIDALLKFGATKVIDETTFLSEDFPAQLKHIIGDQKVRLTLNSVGGKTIAPLVASLSDLGYFVNYGGISGDSTITYLGSHQLQRSLTTVGYWLTVNTERNPKSKVDTLHAVTKLYEDKVFELPEVHEVPFEDDFVKLFLETIKKSGKQIIVYK